MILKYSLSTLPQTKKIYSVTRRTVWRVADPYHILLFIVSGNCTVTTTEETQFLTAGDVLWIPANTSYIRQPVDDELCTMFYVHFTLPADTVSEKQAREELSVRADKINEHILAPSATPRPADALYTLAKLSLGSHTESVTAILQKAAVSSQENWLIADTKRNLAAAQLLCLMAECSMPHLLAGDFPTATRTEPDIVARAVWFVRQHYKEKISLADLCRECAVSQQIMIRAFRQSLGITPTAYIIGYKMDKAREFLATAPGENHRSITVKEVACELGYTDQNYFSRVFTEHTGECPSDYRTRVASFDEKKHIAESKL